MQELDTIGWWSPSELARRILSSNVERQAHPASKLAKAAAKFHADLGCKNQFTESLISTLLENDTVLVRLAHQPNLFPYLQILAQTLHLTKTAEQIAAAGRKVVPLVLVVDYDICGDRVRNSDVVDPAVKQQVRRFTVVPKKMKLTPAHTIPGPPKETREKLGLELVAFCNSTRVKKDYLTAAMGLARTFPSLADFNAFGWANATVCVWNLPVLFIRLSDLACDYEPTRLSLAAQLATAEENDISAYLWGVCPHCGTRQPYASSCCGLAVPIAQSLPRVMVDNLSDYILYGVDGGTSYYSSREHLIEAHQMGLKVGIQVPPEASWRVNSSAKLIQLKSPWPKVSEKAHHLINTGRASLLQYFDSVDHAMALKSSLSHFLDSEPLFMESQRETP